MKRRLSVNLEDGSFTLYLWCGTEDEEGFKVRATKTKPYVMAYGVRYDLTKKEQQDMKSLTKEYNKLHKVAVETKAWLLTRRI